MPIFVSRFSAERIASSGLQRTRTNHQADNRASARNDRAERTERGRGPQSSERAQDQLPVATQTAESIREELETSNAAGLRGEPAEETQADEQRRQSLVEPPTLPGVSTVNTRSKTSAAASQVGRLDRESSNPQAQSNLSRFESLRNAGTSASANARSADVRQAFRDFPSEAQGFADIQLRRQSLADPPQVGRLDRESSNPQVQSTLNRFESLRNAGPLASANARSADVLQAFRDIIAEAQGFAGVQARQLNAQVDASIRLQRSNQGGQGDANGVDRRNPASVETGREVPAPSVEEVPPPSVSLVAESTVVAPQTDDRPTVEQISRANTTPEIQENLRQDASEIERGLRVDAEIQAHENLRQTAQNAERTSEARRESTVDSNDRAVRDLMIQERQIERSLRATQSEIRDLNSENNQLESSVSNVTASTAANLANRTKLIT